MTGRIGNATPIALVRRSCGYSQDDFADFAMEHKDTYSLHERVPDQFRVRELQSIADRLTREQRLMFAKATVETIFGKGYAIEEQWEGGV